jgi:hypothetical protein
MLRVRTSKSKAWSLMFWPLKINIRPLHCRISTKWSKYFKILIFTKLFFDEMSNPHFCDIYLIFHNHNARWMLLSIINFVNQSVLVYSVNAQNNLRHPIEPHSIKFFQLKIFSIVFKSRKSEIKNCYPNCDDILKYLF